MTMDKESNKRKRKTLDDILYKKNKRSKNIQASDEDEEDELFTWEEYLQKCRAKAVPKSAFKHVEDTKAQGFTPGMKVEAKDNTSASGTYWVATVVMVSGPLLLLRFDGYDSDRSGDFWCNAGSEELQPIGWCAKANTILIPPEAIRHKESNWAKFLMKDLRDAIAAPDNLFHKKAADDDDDNILKAGNKLELQDSDDPLCYWVATIVEQFGLRLQLRFEGCEGEENDVWAYYLMDNVHNLGWGKKNGLTLKPPKELNSKLDWSSITNNINKLATSETVQVRGSLKKDDSLPPLHGFQSGMKLEAVNPRDPSSICVATVSRIINEYYFTVQIDDFIKTKKEQRMSFWCHAQSRNIFPCGWCEKNNVSVTPPPGYAAKPFVWSAYLSWSKSKAVPEALFDQQVPSHEFDISLKLEAIDQTKPETITVGTVTHVMGRTVWVQLDGYSNNTIEHIYDVESFDLFPVGWCSMHGYPLLTPQQKKKEPENRRLKSLRVTNQRRAKAGVTSPAGSPTEGTPTRRNSATAKKVDTPTNEQTTTDTTNQETKSSKKKQSPLNTPLKELKPSSVNSTESPNTQTPSSTIPGGRTTRPNGGKPRVEAPAPALSPVSKVSATIDLTEEDSDISPEEGSDNNVKESHICLYVRSSCSCGPFLDKKKLATLPQTIGPAGANSVLRQLVEHIVLSSFSSKKVLQLLAQERDRKTFSSILKTLTSKLNVCENVFSLNKVSECPSCDSNRDKSTNEITKSLVTPSSDDERKPNIVSGLQNGTANQQNNTNPLNLKKTTKHTSPSHADTNDDVVDARVPKKHVSAWSVSDVVDFIGFRDCKTFADIFKEQEVDGKALMLLSLEEIHKVLGVTLGPAIKLHDEVQELRKKPK